MTSTASRSGASARRLFKSVVFPRAEKAGNDRDRKRHGPAACDVGQYYCAPRFRKRDGVGPENRIWTQTISYLALRPAVPLAHLRTRNCEAIRMAKLIKFPANSGEAAHTYPPGWTVVEGSPAVTAYRHYTAGDGRELAGYWRCTPGAFQVVYEKWEFCHLLEGRAILTEKAARRSRCRQAMPSSWSRAFAAAGRFARDHGQAFRVRSRGGGKTAMAERHDAIIIGGGHNGLVCAAYLAKNGLKPLVLERRDVVGGAAVTQEIAPGYRASTFSYLMSILHPRIQADLELKRHGLEIMPCSDMLSPLGDDYIVFSDNVARTQASFRRFNGHDADIYPAFDAFLSENANLFRRLLWETPFDPTGRDWKTFKQAAGFLHRNWRIGGKLFRVLDMLSMSAYDFLSEWFEDDPHQGRSWPTYASIGTVCRAEIAGLGFYVIMHHVMGENAGAGGWGFVKGGMGAITQSIAACCASRPAPDHRDRQPRRRGARSPTAAPAACTRKDGRFYRSDRIISNASAKTLYLDMIGEAHLPAELVRDIRTYRTFSTSLQDEHRLRAAAALRLPRQRP